MALQIRLPLDEMSHIHLIMSFDSCTIRVRLKSPRAQHVGRRLFVKIFLYELGLFF